MEFLIYYDFLAKVLILGFVFLWMRYLWNRRKLYICSIKTPGPLALPIIGCTYLLTDINWKQWPSTLKNMLQGKKHTELQTLLKLSAILSKYKGLARFWHYNKLILCISDPKYIEIILNHPKAVSKDKLYELLVPVFGWGLFTAPVPTWKRNRKLIMPTFNKKILDEFVDVFGRQSNVLVEEIEKNCGLKNPKDVSTLISQCTLDFICETAMGLPEVQNLKTGNEFAHYLEISLEISLERMFNIFYQYDFLFKRTKAYKELKQATDYIGKFVMEIIKRKRAEMEKKFTKKIQNDQTKNLEWKPREKKTFLELLLEMCLIVSGEHQFSNVELYHEILTITIAGSDTAANANCFTLLMLAMHPEIQEKVYKEVIKVAGPDCKIEPHHLPNLKILERVIKETLRLFPLSLIILRSADGDVDLQDGNIIPEGSCIAIGMLEVHRSPDIWPQPLVFDPDRFLPENFDDIHPYAYIPFSAGPRNCIGLGYGMMSMKTLLATVVRSFRLTTTYRSVEEIELKMNIMMRPTAGYKITFHRR